MKIGKGVVVHTATLIVPEHEDAWVEFQLRTWSVRINVVFEDDAASLESQSPVATVSIEGRGDHGRMVLRNWRNPLSTSTTTPIEVGTTDELTKLYVMLWHTRVGAINRVDLQFTEAAAEEATK